jgi:dienelactone hydrolase
MHRAIQVGRNGPSRRADVRINPARIALMGTSRGGRGALYASLKRLRAMWAAGKDFAAYIPLYAACECVSNAPIRQFHGASDDVVSVAPCRSFYERLRAKGKDARLTEFSDVWHLLDNPAAPPGPAPAKIQTLGACEVKEERPSVLVNSATKLPFTWDDSCVGKDTHIGYNEAAMRATHAAVRDLLGTVFGSK